MKSSEQWAMSDCGSSRIDVNMKQITDQSSFPATGAPSYFAYPYSVWDFVPASWSCPFEVERIGRMGDGGKWVCGMSRYEKNQRPLIIYSFGMLLSLPHLVRPYSQYLGVQNESSFGTF